MMASEVSLLKLCKGLGRDLPAASQNVRTVARWELKFSWERGHGGPPKPEGDRRVCREACEKGVPQIGTIQTANINGFLKLSGGAGIEAVVQMWVN